MIQSLAEFLWFTPQLPVYDKEMTVFRALDRISRHFKNSKPILVLYCCASDMNKAGPRTTNFEIPFIHIPEIFFLHSRGLTQATLICLCAVPVEVICGNMCDCWCVQPSELPWMAQGLGIQDSLSPLPYFLTPDYIRVLQNVRIEQPCTASCPEQSSRKWGSGTFKIQKCCFFKLMTLDHFYFHYSSVIFLKPCKDYIWILEIIQVSVLFLRYSPESKCKWLQATHSLAPRATKHSQI